MPMIHELPVAERPREKLLEAGARGLSNTELIAILVGSGTRDRNALAVAGCLLAALPDGIDMLPGAMPEELTKVAGVGKATAAKVLAAAELGVRIRASGKRHGQTVLGPEDAALAATVSIGYERRECLLVLLLNARGELMGREVVSKGGLTSAEADPKDVFRPAVRRGAMSVILCHNHPSGNPEPSESDIAVTKRLSEAGELIGIRVLDHIIIGKNKHVSLKSRHLM